MVDQLIFVNRSEIKVQCIGNFKTTLLFSFFLVLSYQSLSQVKEGIAAHYLFDQEIVSDERVLFATTFKNANWLNNDFKGCTAHYLAEKEFKKPFFSSKESFLDDGSGALEQRQYKDDNGPQPLRIVIPDSLHNLPVYYLRWYQKFETGYTFNFQKGTRLGGRNDGYRLNPGCGYSGGVRYMTWSVNLIPNGDSEDYWARAYYYHNNKQNCGTDSLQTSEIRAEKDEWACFEIMVRQNDVGQKNGEGKIWINGKLSLHIKEIEFRTLDNLYIKWLEFYGGNGKKTRTASQDQSHWIDNVVLAREYIGPMKRKP